MKKLYNPDINSRDFKRWVPSIIVMTFIFMVSSLPGQVIRDIGLGRESFHVNGHFLMFFLLCFAFYKAVKSPDIALRLTLIYALLDEFHQNYVPMRAVSLKDIITDGLAGIIAALILWKLQYILPKQLKTWLSN